MKKNLRSLIQALINGPKQKYIINLSRYLSAKISTIIIKKKESSHLIVMKSILANLVLVCLVGVASGVKMIFGAYPLNVVGGTEKSTDEEHPIFTITENFSSLTSTLCDEVAYTVDKKGQYAKKFLMSGTIEVYNRKDKLIETFEPEYEATTNCATAY